MLGGALLQTGRLDEAEPVLGEAGQAAEASGDSVVHAEIVICRGAAAAYQGDEEAAGGFYQRAVELARAHHSRWTVADAQVSVMVNLHRVRPDEALRAGRAALRAFEELGDPYGKCAAVRGLAVTARVQGRLETALDLHAESHRLAVSHNLPLLEIANRVSEAECRPALGRPRDAIGFLERTLIDSRRLRDGREVACRGSEAERAVLAHRVPVRRPAHMAPAAPAVRVH
jgi:ATP/maltotriose-dependent transcriptional regulator MalT